MIVIAHPRALRRFGRSQPNPAAWVYADNNETIYLTIERLMKRLGAERLVSAEAFDREAGEARQVFVDWIDRNLGGVGPDDWIVAPLAKNPFASNTFLHAVWLILLNRHHRDSLVVFTDSAGLARAVTEQCLKSGKACIQIGGAWFGVTSTIARLRGAARLIFDVGALLYRRALADVILGNEQRRRLAGSQILIDTYLHPGDLLGDGTFRDRYWPGLEKIYQENGFKVASYLFLLPRQRHLIRVYRQIRACPSALCPFELFVRVKDVFSGVRRVLGGLRAKQKDHEPLAGTMMTGLTDELRTKAWLHGLVPLIMSDVPVRLAESNIRPNLVLDWCENQAIDLAHVVGFTKAGYPKAVIGVRQYCLYPNWLSMFSTTREVNSGVAASVQWECGEAQRQAAVRFDSAGQHAVVPALRYQYLYKEDHQSCESDPGDLVVLLTHSIAESARIVRRLTEAAPLILESFRRVRLKAHGDLTTPSVRRFQADLACLGEIAQWEKIPVRELLPFARLVVTAGSSAAVEALCQGIPVVLVGPTAGLSMNPLEGVDRRLWRTVFSGAELAGAIKAWTPEHPMSFGERALLGRATRLANFEPLNAESVARFLPATPSSD